MKREEWRKADRWRRVTQKKLAAEMAQQMEALVTYGTTHPELAAKLAERIVNPPVLLGPMFAE